MVRVDVLRTSRFTSALSAGRHLYPWLQNLPRWGMKRDHIYLNQYKFSLSFLFDLNRAALLTFVQRISSPLIVSSKKSWAPVIYLSVICTLHWLNHNISILGRNGATSVVLKQNFKIWCGVKSRTVVDLLVVRFARSLTFSRSVKTVKKKFVVHLGDLRVDGFIFQFCRCPVRTSFLIFDVDAGLVFLRSFLAPHMERSTLSLLVYSVLSSEEFSLSGSAEGTLRSSCSGFRSSSSERLSS